MPGCLLICFWEHSKSFSLAGSLPFFICTVGLSFSLFCVPLCIFRQHLNVFWTISWFFLLISIFPCCFLVLLVYLYSTWINVIHSTTLAVKPSHHTHQVNGTYRHTAYSTHDTSMRCDVRFSFSALKRLIRITWRCYQCKGINIYTNFSFHSLCPRNIFFVQEIFFLSEKYFFKPSVNRTSVIVNHWWYYEAL